ncbi:RDD family protein [Snodgrassella alvi]|uniref:RDD family protein n=1 Tax=Snodgrassella alvi TaxID=1196083 RepID=UPI003CFFABF8
MQKKYRGSVDFVNSNKSLSALADGKLELASPADRLSAVVINHIIGSLIAMPFYIYYMISIFKFFGTIDPDEADALDTEQFDQFFLNWFNLPLTEIIIGFTFVASIIYTIWQIYWMTKYGQSIGKRLLKIRVIRTNGDNAGFIHNILLREVVYGVIASIVSIMTLGFGSLIFLFIPCMVFATSWHRRTLQDFLAGTIVVKVK